MNAMPDLQKTPPNPAENRTFVGSIAFIEIVGYFKKPVSEQILVRKRFKGLMTAALKGVDTELRLVLDTGDGAAVCFLGDVPDALSVSVRMRDYLRAANGAVVADSAEAGPETSELNLAAPIFNYALRIGINLGPVKLEQDRHGHPQIVGDGINVAQRIVSFAKSDQVVVSQSYFEAISAVAPQHAKLLSYEGARTDKNVRAHEIYVVGDAASIAGLAELDTNATKNISSSDKSLFNDTRERKSKSSTSSSNKRPSSAAAPIPFMQDRNKLLLTGSILAFVVAGLFIVMAIRKPVNKMLVKNASEEIARDNPKTELVSPVAVAAPVPTELAPVTNGAPANTPDPATAPAAPLPATDEKPATVIAKTVVKPVAKPAVMQGTVSFSIQPWGDVYVNGRLVGASPPLKQSKLAPGTYRIEVKNTTFTPYTVSVEVKSQENVSVKHRFQ